MLYDGNLDHEFVIVRIVNSMEGSQDNTLPILLRTFHPSRAKVKKTVEFKT